MFPLAPPGPHSGGGRIDWTAGQVWSGDAFNGRTRTQFVTVAPRPERGRLTVEWIDGAASVVNGYGSDFELLVLADEAGRVFHGVNVPAGGAATLQPITGDDLFLWRERLDERLPAAAAGVRGGALRAAPRVPDAPLRVGHRMRAFVFRCPFLTAAASRGMNEHAEPIKAFKLAPLAADPRVRFAALLAEPAVTEFGGLPVDARGGAHLLIGRPSSRGRRRRRIRRESEPCPCGARGAGDERRSDQSGGDETGRAPRGADERGVVGGSLADAAVRQAEGGGRA